MYKNCRPYNTFLNTTLNLDSKRVSKLYITFNKNKNSILEVVFAIPGKWSQNLDVNSTIEETGNALLRTIDETLTCLCVISKSELYIIE